jgi:hypothetical protein
MAGRSAKRRMRDHKRNEKHAQQLQLFSCSDSLAVIQGTLFTISTSS